MKFLHLSDLHIGKTVNGFSLIDDQRHILKEACRLANSNKVDAIVLAGDLYDKPSPSAEAVALFDEFLSCIAQSDVVCFAIPGNHDSAERIAYASSILSRQGILFPPVFDGHLTHFSLEDEYGECVFWLMPFLKPASVKACFPDQAETIGQSYTEAIRTVLESNPIDFAKRNVLIAHQFVTAGASEPELSDSELTLGGLDNVDASVFEGFDYVALGHIHRPQRIGHDWIRYAGSPLKYSYSEIRYPKSAALVTMGEKGRLESELIELSPKRDMREIKGPLDEIVACAPSGSRSEDYIHAILTDERQPIDALSRLRSVYPNIMGIDFECRRLGDEQRTPASIGSERIEPLELFKSFFEQQHGSPMDPEQISLVQDTLSRTQQFEWPAKEGSR